MKIRKARLNDIKQLEELENRWVKEKTSPRIIKTPRSEWKGMINKGLVVTAEENKIAAYVSSQIRKAGREIAGKIKKGVKYLELEGLYVDREFRGQNLSSLILKELFLIAKKRKLKHILVIADSKELAKLISFYESKGFEPIHALMIKKL